MTHRTASSRERGAAMFVVVLAITLLSAVGMFALRAASLVTLNSGYARQSMQTYYATELAGLLLSSELAINAGTYNKKIMGQHALPGVAPSGQMEPDDCKKLADVGTTLSKKMGCAQFEPGQAQSNVANGYPDTVPPTPGFPASSPTIDNLFGDLGGYSTAPVFGKFLGQVFEASPIGNLPGCNTTGVGCKYKIVTVDLEAHVTSHPLDGTCDEQESSVVGVGHSMGHMLLGPL